MSNYTPTTWVEGGAPGISAANLQHLEDGVQTAHAELTAHAGTGGAAHADASLLADGFMTSTMVAKLAGQHGDQDDFTLGSTGGTQPTLNSSEGLWRSAIGRFGGWVKFEVGATPGTGTYTVALPVAPTGGIAKGNTAAAGQLIGTGMLVETSSGLTVPVWVIAGNTNLARMLQADGSLVTATSPFAFGIGDEINLHLDYPVAL